MTKHNQAEHLASWIDYCAGLAKDGHYLAENPEQEAYLQVEINRAQAELDDLNEQILAMEGRTA